MKTRVAPLFPLVLMAFLAALTLWLQYAVQEGAGGESRPPGHEPDAIIENFTIQNLDAAGKLQYTFSAPKMQHFADDGSGEVLYPRVVQIAAEGGNFIATANRGTINRQGEEAFLYGNVLVMREARACRTGNPAHGSDGHDYRWTVDPDRSRNDRQQGQAAVHATVSGQGHFRCAAREVGCPRAP